MTEPIEMLNPTEFHEQMMVDDKTVANQGAPVYLRRYYVAALHNCVDFPSLFSQDELGISDSQSMEHSSPLFARISHWYRVQYPFEWLNVPLTNLVVWDDKSDVMLRPIIGVEGEAIMPREHLVRPELHHLLEGGALAGYRRSILGLICLRQMPSRNNLMELALFNFQQGHNALTAPVPDYADARWQIQQALEKLLKAILVVEGFTLEQIKHQAGHNIVTFFHSKSSTLLQLIGQTTVQFSEQTSSLCELIECSTSVRYGERHPRHAKKDEMTKAASHRAYHAFLQFIADNAAAIKACLNKQASEDSQIRRGAEYALMWPSLLKDYSISILGLNHYVGRPLTF